MTGFSTCEPTERFSTFSLFLILTLFTFTAYHTLIGNGFYTLDDYLTIDFGFADSLWGSMKETVRFMAEEQHRFQPVRLSIFVLATRLFPEQWSVFFALLLHLLNIALFLSLFKRFKVSPFVLFSIAAYFTLFGRWRVMNGLSATVGGSELVITLFLTASLLLLKAVENNKKKRKLFYVASLFVYLLLMLSYEIAVPLLLPLFTFFILARFVWKNSQSASSFSAIFLIPYFLIALAYFVGTKLFLPHGAGYTGTNIQIGYETIERFITNLRWNFTFQVRLADMKPRPEWVLFFLGYYSIVYLNGIREKTLTEQCLKQEEEGNILLLLFSFLLYLSLVVLFTISNWGTPDIFMVHHNYEMTFGSSVLTISLLFVLANYFDKKTKHITSTLLIWLLLPLLLLAGMNFNLQFGEQQQKRTKLLTSIQNGLLKHQEELLKKDAILLKHFSSPYAEVSSYDGALAKWFHFKKKFMTGQDIVSVQKNKITFNTPLSYYGAKKKATVANSKLAIFFINQNGQPIPYGDEINRNSKIGLFQIERVQNRKEKSKDSAMMKLILKQNERLKQNSLTIGFKKRIPHLFREIELTLNGEPVKLNLQNRTSVTIPLSLEQQQYTYLFLSIRGDEKILNQASYFKLEEVK